MKNIIIKSLLLIFFSHFALANITALKVTGKKAVLEFDSANPLEKGDKLKSVDGNTLVIIGKVKGNKAIANIKSGEAQKGMQFAKAGANKKKGKEKSITESPLAPTPEQKNKLLFGILAGVGMGSMEVALTDISQTQKETAKLSGMGITVKGFADMPLGSVMFLRGSLGYESIDTTGTLTQFSLCGGSTKCVVQIPFIAADGIAGIYFVNRSWKFYGFGGGGLLFPMGPNTNALNSSSIKQSGAIRAGAGLRFGKFPIEVEYEMLPPSSDVKTTVIQIRTGYAF